MFRVVAVSVGVILSGCASPPAEDSASAKAAFKRVPFNTFFANKVTPLPLSIEVPNEYEHAAQMKTQPTYAYWMRPSDMERASKGPLPADNGYIYGKVSLDVGYDAATKSFNDEASEAQLKKEGFDLLRKRRFEVGGYPALSMTMRASNGKVVCAMYVATLVSTNSLYFGYRPAANNEQLCARMQDSLKKG